MQSFGGHTLYNLQNHVCWGDRDSIYKIILSHAYLVRTCDLSVGGELRLAVKGDSINQRVTTCDNCFTGQPRQNMCWLVVYLPHPTPLKNDGVKVSWDDDIPFPYEMENKSHVWNHQAVCDSLTHLPRSKPVGWTWSHHVPSPCLHHGTQWHAARLVHPPWSARQTGDVLHAWPKSTWRLIDLPNTQNPIYTYDDICMYYKLLYYTLYIWIVLFLLHVWNI